MALTRSFISWDGVLTKMVFIVRNAPNMDTNIDMMSKLRLLEKINLNKSQKIEYTRCYVLYCGSVGARA